MSDQNRRGIPRKGLDAAFEVEEAQVSRLLLEAKLLKEQGRLSEAADKFAEAAQAEEQLCRILQEKGLTEMYFVAAVSAASCWAQAGNIYQAIVEFEQLLKHPDLTDRLRQWIENYLPTLRARREQWFAAIAQEAAAQAVEG